jgi:hypothetical protein
VLQPIKVSCADQKARASTHPDPGWKNSKITSDRYVIDDDAVAPMVREAAPKYAAEKKVTTGCLLTNRDAGMARLLSAKDGSDLAAVQRVWASFSDLRQRVATSKLARRPASTCRPVLLSWPLGAYRALPAENSI